MYQLDARRMNEHARRSAELFIALTPQHAEQFKQALAGTQQHSTTQRGDIAYLFTDPEPYIGPDRRRKKMVI